MWVCCCWSISAGAPGHWINPTHDRVSSWTDLIFNTGLTFVCTDPKFQGNGAGSSLARKVQDAAEAAGVPVYLESTMEAVKMYEKLGFLPVDSFKMTIPGHGQEERTEFYEETCMLWNPGTG